MNNKNLILAAVVVIVVIVAAVVAWQMTSGDDEKEESPDVSSMANNFADNYTSNFGDFYVETGATSESASVMADTGSDRMPHSKFTYSVADDAKAQFGKIKAEIESKQAMMGAQPVIVKGISGFDDISVVKFDVVMGTMSRFTMVYFVAYSGNILIDGSEQAFYHSSALATKGEVTKLFKAVADSLAMSCKASYDASAMAKYMDDNYKGGFGDFYVDSGATAGSATAKTDTGSSRMPHSSVKYTVASDAKAQYGAIKSAIESKEGFMGGTPTKVDGIKGFDDVTVYKMDIVMGTMMKFTLVYFVAYTGDVLIDCSDEALYFSGDLASDSAISSALRTVAMSVYA